MKTFTVTITEELVRSVEVSAENAEDALNLVQTMYNNQDIVLDADDFASVNFDV